MNARDEQVIPPPKTDPGMQEVDDHTPGTSPRGDAQPTRDLDRGVSDDHIETPSQGTRPEAPPEA